DRRRARRDRRTEGPAALLPEPRVRLLSAAADHPEAARERAPEVRPAGRRGLAGSQLTESEEVLTRGVSSRTSRTRFKRTSGGKGLQRKARPEVPTPCISVVSSV